MLFADLKYKSLSSDAKLTYALLYDRLSLSKLNAWINEKDEVYLIDYGAAVILNEAEEYVRENEVIYGTRGFAAPEQYEKDIGPVIGKRTDIYGIGALLEKMLSYYKNDKSMTGRKHILRECERITKNCTRRVYSRRYADAGEVKSEIINLLNY